MFKPASKPLLCLGALFAVLTSAQEPAPPADQNAAAEMTYKDTPATFRTKVNLVLVPVVAVDRDGHPIGTLRKEDFQVFDKGKLQAISSFSIEKAGDKPAIPVIRAEPVPGEIAPTPAESQPGPMPDRFTAYLFDDVHLEFGDLSIARDAAEKHINASLLPTDRAGIFTTSGRTTLDFTDDRAKLHETLLRLQPQPIARFNTHECPDINYYQADLIQNKNDQMALQAAASEDMTCHPPPQGVPPLQALQMAMQNARVIASQVVPIGDTETHVSLGVIKDVVRRLSTMPGQRSLIIVSPGFLTLEDTQQDKTTLIDRAIKANVIINSLNARGLYVILPGGDASQSGPFSANAAVIKSQFANAAAQAEEDVMSELAFGTGGAYFHNNNDLVEGFKRVAARPDFVYVLGFSPENLKLDGHFHTLKVVVRQPRVTLQARRGYFAPQHLADPKETAKEEIQDALFSREELRDIPLELHTQFFKPTEDSAKVAVLVRVDVKHLRFKKENGRNRDDLTVVSGLFDRNGNLVTGNQKTVEMRLLDQTLEKKLAAGITVRSSFDVKPGSYLIRLVIRDTEGETMAAANGAVEIP